MRKRLLAFLMAVFLVSVGLAFQMEAAEDPGLARVKTCMNLIKASLQGDPNAARDLDKFFAGHPVPMREIRQGLAEGFHKIAWRMPSLGDKAWIVVNENLKQPKATKWRVIYADEPPADAKIIETRR